MLSAGSKESSQENNRWYFLIDDKIIGPDKKYNEVHSITFSDDGKKLAFLGYQYDGKYTTSLVTINLETGEFTDVNVDSLVKTLGILMKFTPDGTKLVKIISQAGKQSIMIGDKNGPEFDQIDNFFFSPDGKYLGYGARKGHELWWMVEKL